MIRKLKNLIADDSGAVTVDWVVLTAAVIAMNIVVIVTTFEDVMKEGGESISETAANIISD